MAALYRFATTGQLEANLVNPVHVQAYRGQQPITRPLPSPAPLPSSH
ncbi:MAG: hypothetical protein M1143_02705 [Candidatus Thermoplasmatota archaeon]|nr:hypothetical protein [Candidatus Thermoplasmatota archaeon]